MFARFLLPPANFAKNYFCKEFPYNIDTVITIYICEDIARDIIKYHWTYTRRKDGIRLQREATTPLHHRDIGSRTCANRVIVDTSHFTATCNPVSTRRQLQRRQEPSVRTKSLKRTRNVDPFLALISLKSLQFWKKREYIFRLSCAITDGLERHFVNDIDLFVASRNVPRIFFSFFFFFSEQYYHYAVTRERVEKFE